MELKWERVRCGLCRREWAEVFMVLRTFEHVTKVRVCFRCFGLFEAVVGGDVEAVSLRDYEEAVETAMPELERLREKTETLKC